MFDRSLGLYENFIGTGMIAGLFLVALLYLFVTEKNKNNRVMLVYMPAALFALFFFPPFAAFVDHFVGTEVYFRFLWLVPTLPVIAYAAVRVVLTVPAGKKAAAGTAVALILILSGSFIYGNPEYGPAQNAYHIPRYVVDVCDAIREENEIVIAAFPAEFLLYVRQYDVNIWMPYGRDHYRGIGLDQLYDKMQEETLNVGRIADLAKKRKCHYVIVPGEKETDGEWQDYGYELYAQVDGYLIYRDTEMPPGLNGYWLTWEWEDE